MTHYTTTTKTQPRRRAARYPNAATARQIADRWLDRLLCAAAWIGIVTMVLFLAVL